MADSHVRIINTAGVVLGFLSALALSVSAQPSQEPVLAAFDEGVAGYLALRHEIEQHTAAPRESDDPDEFIRAGVALAEAMAAVRGAAGTGDVLTLEVGIMLRQRIERTMQTARLRTADLLADCDDVKKGVVRDLVVNDVFPWAWTTVMPASLMDVLPALPKQLQFRLVGSSLVLIDIDTDLIVDILPDALPLVGRVLTLET